MRTRNRNDESQVLDLRIMSNFVDGVDGRVRNVVPSQLFDPMRQIVPRKPLIECQIQRLIVRDSFQTGVEALISRQFRRIQRSNQALPKFLQ